MRGPIVVALLTVVLAGCTSTVRSDTRLEPLPEDPCQLLSIRQVSRVTGLNVTEARRLPGIDEIVEAQRQNRKPGPGTICSYKTESEFGAIAVSVPMLKDRSAANYWSARTEYFRDFPNAAHPVPGLGEDAWISGGASLHVLVGGDEYFGMSTQFGQRSSRDLLVGLARAVLDGSRKNGSLLR